MDDTSQTIRALGIVRVSDTDNRDERLRSLRVQERAIRAYCDRHDWATGGRALRAGRVRP